MLTVIAVIHVAACFLLISLVLLQDPKSTGGSAMFGGSGSNTVIGATGGASLLQRLTRYAAIVFGVCCLLLTIMGRNNDGGSVMDKLPVAAPTAPMTAPAKSLDGAPVTTPHTAPPTSPAK